MNLADLQIHEFCELLLMDKSEREKMGKGEWVMRRKGEEKDGLGD